MGRHIHPSEQSHVKKSGSSAGVGKRNSAANNGGTVKLYEKPSSAATPKDTVNTSSKSTEAANTDYREVLSGGVSTTEKDPNSKTYRPDRWNADGTITEVYQKALDEDEHNRIMSEGGWGKGYYDKETGETYHGMADDGSKVFSASSKSAYSFDDDPYQDYLDALEEQYDDQADIFEKQVKEAVYELESQKDDLKQQYEDGASQAYVQNMLSQKNLEQLLAAQGLNGGASESAMVRLESEYGNNLNELLKLYNQSINQLDRDIASVRNNGEISLAQNAAQYKQALANAMLQEYQRQKEYEQRVAQMMLQAQINAAESEQALKDKLAYLAAQQQAKYSSGAKDSSSGSRERAIDSAAAMAARGDITVDTLNDNLWFFVNQLGYDGYNAVMKIAKLAYENGITPTGLSVHQSPYYEQTTPEGREKYPGFTKG